MLYLHSTARNASSQIIKILSQFYKPSFAQRAAHVWLWYTSHAQGYVPSRQQAKAELGLSDYILTNCLRALERIGLASLDLVRRAGKCGCWIVHKTTNAATPTEPPPTPQPPPPDVDFLPPNFCHPNGEYEILPPNFSAPTDDDLPPSFSPPLGEQEKHPINNINNPPLPHCAEQREWEGGVDNLIDDFLSIYPKMPTPEHTRIATAALRERAKQLRQHYGQPTAIQIFNQFISEVLIPDVINRQQNCHHWRELQFMPNVARYITEQIFYSKPIAPRTATKHAITTRQLRLSDELSRDWAA